MIVLRKETIIMKKVISLLLIMAMVFACCFALSACGGGEEGGAESGGTITIAVPNDTTNEARALLLLQELGYIKLKADAGITATPRDIEDNPKNIEFAEIEAAQLPSALKDYDYAVINSNYAIDAGLNPVKDSLGIEGSASGR